MMFLMIAGLALQAQPAGDAKPVKEKKVCRKIEVMGSNIPNQDCRTAAEWKAADASSRMNTEDRTQLQRMVNQGQLVRPN